MKTLRFLMVGLGLWLGAVFTGQAQTTNDLGWFNAPMQYVEADPPDGGGQQSKFLGMQGSAPSIAEAITPEIQALARGLENDPVRIFNYVHDHIRHVLYFGSKKGAQLTLLERSGNEFDQCALLVALLRSAGYTNTGYQFGWTLMPYENPDGSHRDLKYWLKLNLPNTNWDDTVTYLESLFENYRNYPITRAEWGANIFGFQRLWVTLTNGPTVYLLDPAFKVSQPISGINLTNAMGLSSNALMAAAAGFDGGYYVTNLNEADLRNTLRDYTTNLLDYLQNNNPNASVEEVLGGWRIEPATNTALSQTLLFPTTNWGGQMPVLNWANIPTNMMASLKITLAGTNCFGFIPELQGQRLTLTYNSSGVAELWQDDTRLLQKSTTTSDTTVALQLYYCRGTWNTNNNSFVPDAPMAPAPTGYQRLNSTYALVYAFDPSMNWLQSRQKQLESYRQRGLADSSREVLGETLNVMGLSWMLQHAQTEQMLATQLGMLLMYNFRFGRMAQESGQGYYIDVYAQHGGSAPDSPSLGTPAGNKTLGRQIAVSSFFGSALEHGLIEQLQSSNLVAASTVKMLEIASTNRQKVFLVNSTNWASGDNVQSQLTGYTSATTNEIYNRYIIKGYQILLPQNGSNHIAGAGSWAGYGYAAIVTTGAGMRISGNYYGGYSAYSSAYVSPSYIYQNSFYQPAFYNPAPLWTPSYYGADPVNMADSSFEVQDTDLSLGQAEPRGLTLSRYYSSSRRFSNPAGMAAGWLHNYSINLAEVAASQAGLGATMPQQMAAMLVATRAALELYDGQQSAAKNWLVTTLIAKWGADQLIKNGVSVALGKDTVQFVKQPNGSFTPPANCTMTLTQTNSAYQLTQRHGNTFRFDAQGRLTNIVDQYNQSLTVSYINSTSSLPQTVTDWKTRSLTFNYTGTPQRLTSVSNSLGRSVAYAYSTNYNTNGDLVSVTDPENKTRTFTYDTNHQITATFNALNQLVATNLYDGFGRVTTQYTQGDTNKMWQVYWSDWQTVEQDPAGGKRRFSYDDGHRLISLQDALGNISQMLYDGQDHAVMKVSPLNETNRSIYDSNHNLIQSIDPLVFTNTLVYDGQNNLVQSVDARGNASTFGYNAQFSLTGSTNAAGDWVTLGYNSDGTLSARTDAGGTTSYGYDSFGQLKTVTYPGGLGSETNLNNALGDVTNHTDARGFVTTFQYNNRRELTNTIAPTNLTVKTSYDAVGNVATTTDARGNITSNTWSATRHLVATTLPATPQGTPMVTNLYDNRDWLFRTINNPLSAISQTNSFTNDLAQRLISVTDPLARTTTFGYDADGHQIASTNAAQAVTRQEWSARGELLKTINPQLSTINRVYDATGNQITLTNRNGKKWQFQFDAANRLTNTITPLGRSTSQAYNNRGLLASVKDPANQTSSLYYDAKGRLTNRTDNVGTTLYSFDANDNRTNVVENGKTNSWTYDAYNRVTSYKDVSGNLIQYRYDANGNMTNLIYPGNRTVAYFYDSLNRVTNVTDWANRKTTIAYDLASRMTSLVRPNGSYRTIGYDVAGQATNILEQMSNSLPIAIFKHGWTNTGNMAWEFAAPLPHAATVPTRTMTYDDDNRLATVNGSSVASDSDGNLTSAPLTNATFASYVYDARNRLLNAGGVTNAYDALNNRISQTSGTNTTTFVVNPNAKLPQVLMRIKNGVTNYYVYGAGLLYQITETATATNTLTYHFDYRGSAVALSADNGLVTDRIEYSAYGLTTYRAGTNDTPFLFNGRYGVQTDANGLLYMRARYYNPYLCRFVSSDPSGFSGGLNFFAYANGNPVSLIDPFGLGAFGENAGTSWLSLTGNGLNNTVSSIGQSIGQGLYDLTQLTWSQNEYHQIGNLTYSPATPENPAATPYIVGALGVSGAAAVTAGSVGILEATFLGNQSIMVEGVLGGGNSGSGGLLQLRVPGEPPIIRFDYHPIPGSGGSPVPHIDSPPLGWSHWPW